MWYVTVVRSVGRVREMEVPARPRAPGAEAARAIGVQHGFVRPVRDGAEDLASRPARDPRASRAPGRSGGQHDVVEAFAAPVAARPHRRSRAIGAPAFRPDPAADGRGQRLDVARRPRRDRRASSGAREARTSRGLRRSRQSLPAGKSRMRRGSVDQTAKPGNDQAAPRLPGVAALVEELAKRRA